MTVWSLAPPLLALGVAVGSRRVVPALAAGGLLGTVLLAALQGPGWVWALPVGAVDFVRIGILGRVSEPGNAQMLVLIALIGGFVHLLDTSGSARALLDRLAASVRTPAQAQLATWVGGLVLFFSDFGNVLILGPMFRPLFDRMGLARERLAWIIDTTASPVCVLVPVIAWGVYAAGLIESAVPDTDGFAVLITALPFQLYPWLSLLFIPLMVGLGRSFGPMARAVPASDPAVDVAAPRVGAGAALASLTVLFAVLLAVGAAQVWVEGKVTGAIVRTSLAAAYLAATGTLVASLGGGFAEVRDGMGRSIPILVLLVLAWTLGEVCKQLGTGAFLAAAIGPSFPSVLLPAAIFLVGAVISFATGTSWGTFAILMPIGLMLGEAAGVPMAVVVGAVLSGGVFGDHCSPISDTTMLASVAADTDHAAHVATQLPYALSVGAAALVGFVVAGVTGSAFSVVAGAAVVLGVVGASRLTPARLGPR